MEEESKEEKEEERKTHKDSRIVRRGIAGGVVFHQADGGGGDGVGPRLEGLEVISI